MDGPYDCPPPKGLASVITSANTFVKGPGLNDINESVEWLTQYIENNGPYDCICAFSKASVVVASMLINLSREEKNVRDRIMPKSLVFMNGSIEYSFLEELGLPITDEARDVHFLTEELVKSRTDAMGKLAITKIKMGAGTGLWDDTSKLVHAPKKLPPLSDCFGLDFTLFPEDLLIDIPTVHIVGAKDPIWPSSTQLSYLCEPSKRSYYDHKSGHDLPRTTKVTNDITKIFRDLSIKVKV